MFTKEKSFRRYSLEDNSELRAIFEPVDGMEFGINFFIF
jgi:hypothetical protein